MGEFTRCGNAEGVSLTRVNLSGKRTVAGRDSGENPVSRGTDGETYAVPSWNGIGQLSGNKDRA